MVESVPPGGNWKDIPDSIPSGRLAQIRESFAAGEGSRSTYYGRLRHDEPSYTISTHFNRPGNGCYIHYDFAGGQHRMISQREAARFQSFPDSFAFTGPQSSVNRQIGNAVPPLLAYRLAGGFPARGSFVDLFCGAGGLALGFHFAGWNAVAANDIDARCLETHRRNLAVPAVLGDIREPAVFEEVVRVARTAFFRANGPRVVLGGPPCQGYSTAGNRRTMKDERNLLFHQYAAVLKSVYPDYFVFENVMGILNMDGGHVFDMVTCTLTDAGYDLSIATLRAEEHGIPQRRARVVITGTRNGIAQKPSWPAPTTQLRASRGLFDLPPAPNASAAIGDLPPLSHGQNGSSLDYSIEAPANAFQSYARGAIDAAAYFAQYATVVASA